MGNLKTFEDFDPFGIKKRRDKKAEKKREDAEKREKIISYMEERLDKGEISRDGWLTFMRIMNHDQ